MPDGSQGVSKHFQSLMDKRVFPGEYQPNYWVNIALDRIIKKCIPEYIKARQELIIHHTKKYEDDGKKQDASGKILKEWKKGDPISFPDGTPDWIDAEAFVKEMNELQEIEVSLDIDKIQFDPKKGPDATPGEMQILLPLLKEPE